jgi:hypothetical protein
MQRILMLAIHVAAVIGGSWIAITFVGPLTTAG